MSGGKIITGLREAIEHARHERVVTVTWEGRNMSELYLISETDDGMRLSIAPMTSTKLARCVETPIDTSGYFLTEEDTRDPLGVITILARIEDDESAFRLGRMFAMT